MRHSDVQRASNPVPSLTLKLFSFANCTTSCDLYLRRAISSSPHFQFFCNPVSKRRQKIGLISLRYSTNESFLTDVSKALRIHYQKISSELISVRLSLDDHEGGRHRGCECDTDNNGRIHLNSEEVGNTGKVLILMSDTGGGHRASAEAIKAAFEEEFGSRYKVFITDLSEHVPWPLNQLPKVYNFLVNNRFLWKVVYLATAPRVVHQLIFAVTSRIASRSVTQVLMKHQPDIIISVHPLMQHTPLRLLQMKDLRKKVIFCTVVTDLSTCHPTWFHQLVTRCYCPNDHVAKGALKAGLDLSQVRVFGHPVRPSFAKPVRGKEDLRREVGVVEKLPAVLLMGGGEGVGPIEATAQALNKSLFNEDCGVPVGQILVICGHNQTLAQRLRSITWNIPVLVKGFVNEMEKFMGACDCIITKAGPGTISEAMIRGLPMILNDFIEGQETGNVPYVVENGLGKFLRSPAGVASLVAEWFGPRADELETMSRNAAKMARPNAVFDIVHDLHELVNHKKLSPDTEAQPIIAQEPALFEAHSEHV